MNPVALLEQAAATVGALSVLGGGAWWILKPRAQAFVDGVRRTTELVGVELRPNGGGSLHDNARRAAHGTDQLAVRLDRAAVRLGAVEAVLGDHLEQTDRGLARLGEVEHATAALAVDVRDVVRAQRAELTIYRALLAGAGVLTDDEAPLGRAVLEQLRKDMK